MPTMSSTVTTSFRYRANTLSDWIDDTNVYGATAYMPVSINHYPLNTDVDDGGNWFMTKSIDVPQIGFHRGTNFVGQFVANRWPGYIPPSAPQGATDAQLDANGATGISRSAPTNPAFSLSTSLGELASDGLPMIAGASFFKERAKVCRDAGSEYLNVQFGWLPLLSDIRGFAAAVKESDKLLSAYRKGSDTKMRKGYQFPSDRVDFSNYRPQGGFQASSTYSNLSGPGSLTGYTERKKWFKGAFRYHIPSSDTQLGKFKRWASYSDHLLGWKVTPETLWNIAPWSWAVDWFTNAGDVMSNISSLGKDGLVMQYGYSMQHSIKETRIFATYNTSEGQTPLNRYQLVETKQRRAATPYGFGTNLSTLTSRQIAIIAALGLSRT
jgi:hypothetical protein